MSTPTTAADTTQPAVPHSTFPAQMVWTVAMSALSIIGWLAAGAVLALDRHEPAPLAISVCAFAGSCGVVAALLGIDYRRREAAAADRVWRHQMFGRLLDAIVDATGNAAMAAAASVNEARRGGYVEGIREAFSGDEGGSATVLPLPRQPNGRPVG